MWQWIVDNLETVVTVLVAGIGVIFGAGKWAQRVDSKLKEMEEELEEQKQIQSQMNETVHRMEVLVGKIETRVEVEHGEK